MDVIFCFFDKVSFRVNPEATANQVGIFMSIMLTDQGARPPLDFSPLLSQMTYLFHMLDLSSEP